MKNLGVMTVLVGDKKYDKERGEIGLRKKSLIFSYRVNKSSGDLLPSQSGASRMKNDGVMTVLVRENKYDKREGENRVKGKNH